MKTIARSSLAMIAILFGLLMPTVLVMPVYAEVTEHYVKIPYATEVYNPGVDETVQVTGYLHILIIDFDGSTYRVFHSNLQGVSGIGMTSGVKYRATDSGTTVVNINPSFTVFEMTTTYNSRLIGPGKGNNLLIHSVFHITFVNGELTALVAKSWIEVK